MFTLESVRYKNILNIKNMRIKAGIVTCILGESGSGKTTLLKLLNKLISCDSGVVYYKGTPIEDIDSVIHRREVVMLSQTPAVFEGDIKENLTVGLKFSNKQEVSDSVLEAMLKQVKLDKKLSDSTKNLSGGEQQRLALGRVILLHPEVLLLDEPSSSLDEETEKFVISGLVEYAKDNNKTLIMVTHSKKIADQFADEIIKIEKDSEFDMGEEI